MKKFALISSENKVVAVIEINDCNTVCNKNILNEDIGVEYIYNTLKIKDFYSVKEIKLLKENENVGITYEYKKQLNGFVAPKRYESWVLNESKLEYEAPKEKPSVGTFEWNEEQLDWIEITIENKNLG